MREILFRAWWKDGGGLVGQNDYVIRPNGTIEFPEGGWDLWGSDDSDLVVLEQFTGVVDKNGKKIFEGDIMLLCDKYKCVIEYDKELARFKAKGLDRLIVQVSVCFWSQGQIIGNIHDNPELLGAE